MHDNTMWFGDVLLFQIFLMIRNLILIFKSYFIHATFHIVSNRLYNIYDKMVGISNVVTFKYSQLHTPKLTKMLTKVYKNEKHITR